MYPCFLSGQQLPSAQLKDYHLPSSATHHDHGAPGMVGGYRVGATSAYQSMPSITEHGSTRHSAVALPHIGQAGGRAAKAAVPLKQPKRVKVGAGTMFNVLMVCYSIHNKLMECIH